MGLGDRAQHRLYGRCKRRLFASIEGRGGAPPVVVEVGAGTGLNARYLPEGTQWIVVEPNVHFHDAIREKAAAHGLALDLRAGTAEALPLVDGVADAVVSTLVLCSVADVRQSLAEARRGACCVKVAGSCSSNTSRRLQGRRCDGSNGSSVGRGAGSPTAAGRTRRRSR